MLINRIDAAAMLTPVSPEGWTVEGSDVPRFGWDEQYIKKFNQKFSPWMFAKNCGAVLGRVRKYGLDETMVQMADHLMSVAAPHIESIGSYRYVKNNFTFGYLWLRMKPPFYGAFMNNVTAHGLLYLYEATREDRFLILADRLLMTSVDVDAPIQLCSQIEEGLWLHEYVFKSEPANVPWADYMRNGEWSMARVFNGHFHALFALMRYRAMTGLDYYDTSIAEGTRLMGSLLENQIYDNQYYSYAMEMPVYPDYGQERAMLLANSLAELSGNEAVQRSAKTLTDLWSSIKPRDAELRASGFTAAEKVYLAAKASN